MTTNYVKSWFTHGDEDLVLVKIILEKEIGSTNLACFHAQQAAEKYLKGFLAHHDLHIRKIHDLEIIIEDCKNVDTSFSELKDSAIFLNQFYIESRYPDDYIEFSREDAEKACQAVLRIKEFVLEKIKSQKDSGGFGTTAVLLIVAVVLIVGGFFGYQYLKLQKMREGIKPLVHIPTPTPVSLPVSTPPSSIETKYALSVASTFASFFTSLGYSLHLLKKNASGGKQMFGMTYQFCRNEVLYRVSIFFSIPICKYLLIR